MIRKILVSAICTVAVLFCMSCAGTAGGGADDNVGYLVFSGNARSLPAGKTYNDLSSIELYGSYRGGSEKKLASWSTGSELNNSQVEVKVGRWEFRLTGTLSNAIYSKKISMDIKADEDNVAVFNMQLMGYPLSTLSVGDIILDNGYGVGQGHYDDVSSVANVVAIVAIKEGSSVYGVGKFAVSNMCIGAVAASNCEKYDPNTGSVNATPTGWRLASSAEIRKIFPNRNVIMNTASDIGGNLSATFGSSEDYTTMWVSDPTGDPNTTNSYSWDDASYTSTVSEMLANDPTGPGNIVPIKQFS